MLRAISVLVGAVLIVLSLVMFKWYLDIDYDNNLRLLEIILYGVIGMVIIVEHW